MAEQEDGFVFSGDQFIKIFLIILSFLKCIHFLIVYQEFGFFIKMITSCLEDLQPFLIMFVCFVSLFTVLYAVMDVDIDDSLLTAGSRESMGFVGLLFL